jgi:hypothetical protein
MVHLRVRKESHRASHLLALLGRASACQRPLAGNANTGLFSPAANTVNISTNGVNH